MSGPLLGVVVAAADTAEGVSRCVAPLLGNLHTGQIEVVVAAPRGRVEPPPGLNPAVRWVAADPGARVARLRWLGLQVVRSPIVVFIEDSCVPRPGWADAWIEALREIGDDVATGTVGGPARPRALDRALLVFEYGPTLNPLDGPAARLAGNNFGAATRLARQLSSDRGEVHEALWTVGRARRTRVVRGAVVDYHPACTLREALTDRVRCGLEYGRLRASATPLWKRPALLPAAPAIWAIQLARLGRCVGAKPGYRLALLAAAPHLALIVAAWSLGEWFGWLTGPPPRRPLADDLEQRPEAQRQESAGSGRHDAVVQLRQ